MQAAGVNAFVMLQVKFGEGRRYTYKGGYFETRSSVKSGVETWEGCPDLFGPGEDGAGIYD